MCQNLEQQNFILLFSLNGKDNSIEHEKIAKQNKKVGQQQMKLKSLFQWCIDFIASNAHEIESLENFPLGTIHILRNHF